MTSQHKKAQIVAMISLGCFAMIVSALMALNTAYPDGGNKPQNYFLYIFDVSFLTTLAAYWFNRMYLGMFAHAFFIILCTFFLVYVAIRVSAL